jgi:Cof subfamily protein (haloacid dehalogenase superfamily)
MSYHIVFFDIDGTLINEDRRIPDSTKESIRRLRNNNIEIVIATGRAPCQFDMLADDLDIHSFVSCNGGYVVYKGETIYKNPISKNSLEQLVNVSCKCKHPLVFVSSNNCYSNYNQHPHVNEAFHWLKLNHTPDYNPDCWKETDIFQVYLYCQQHEETYYTKYIDDLTLLRAYSTYMDVFPRGGSKAKGVEAILNHLGLSPSEAVAFGDGLNDREMLSFVGMGIAMGNAHEGLLPYADWRTRHVNDDGILYGLQKVGLI